MKRREFIIRYGSGALALSLGTGFAQEVERRDVSLQNFKSISGGSLRISDGLKLLKKNEKGNIRPVLREEILDNPNAVFIIYGGIRTEKDSKGVYKPCPDQMERLGRRVGELVFRKGTETKGRTFIKPNMVAGFRGENSLVQCHGGIVHPFFTAGLAASLHDLGNSNIAAGARGGMSNEQFRESGCKELFDSHGLPLIEANVQPFKNYLRSELEWHENPYGMVNRRFCTYKPAFLDDTDFINIAHAHTHKVGHTTLTIKNIQGVMPRGYGHICDSWASMDIWRRDFIRDFNPGYRSSIEESYIRHGNMGYKYWDDGGFYKSYRSAGGYEAFSKAFRTYEKSRGDDRKAALDKLYDIADSRLFWVEQWAQRMMDIIEVLPPPMLNMVEGIFGRGHDSGIVLTDFIVLGRNTASVDSVASWLMGHDPREIPYLKIASERGIGQNDIDRIAVYLLDENGPAKVKDPRDLKRHALGIYNLGMSDTGTRFF